MSYIPDCRSDECYNEKYLVGNDDNFVAGYDYCAKEAVDAFFDNLDIYEGVFDIDGEDINLARFLENHAEVKTALREALQEYVENRRDELITSFIDDMDEDEFAKTKERVDKSGEKNRTLRMKERLEG